MNLINRFIIICFILMCPSPLEAHDSVCHIWHSCPSDRGSYICGGLGHCSQCPDNQYCERGKPIKFEEPEPETEQKSKSTETSPPLRGPDEVYVKPTPNEPEEVYVKSTPKEPGNAKKGESYYRDSICMKWNGASEYSLDDGARVDCLTDKYVVEFGLSNEWAEAVGQVLYYSMKTGKKAGLVLIMNGNSSQAHLERLKDVVGHYRLDIKIWILKVE